jgi:galactokinase
LAWVKGGMLEIIRKVSAHDTTFNIHKTSIEEALNYKTLLSLDEMALLRANLSDRDILRTAKTLFENNEFTHQEIGNLLNKHQDSLRDAKKVSTPKIDKMIESALNSGAFGAKINGSGGGGCMFAYAPENPTLVAEAIERAGGKSYVINVAEGTSVV